MPNGLTMLPVTAEMASGLDLDAIGDGRILAAGTCSRRSPR